MGGKASLNIELHDGIHFLKGVLDENASLAVLESAQEPLKLNFGGLLRCNSIGIRTLLRFIRTWGNKPFFFYDCPVEFIYQINMIPSLLGFPERVGKVVSFSIPYECEDCDFEEEIKVKSEELGGEEPVGKWGHRTCSNCKGQADIVDFSYFSFLK